MVGSLATRIVATGTLCVVLVACVGARSLTTSSAEATIDPFAAVVSVDNFNSDITLRLEFATSAPRIGESFVLLLENQTNESILFPNDFGTRVYCYSEESEQWLEIENLVTTMTTADVVLDPKGQGFFWQDFVDVTPDVPNNGRAVLVRVVVVGQIYENGKPAGEKVAAYADIELEP